MRFCFGYTAFAAFIGVKAKLLWVSSKKPLATVVLTRRRLRDKFLDADIASPSCAWFQMRSTGAADLKARLGCYAINILRFL